MSPRTLQRRLLMEGMTLRRIIDETRREDSFRRLRAGDPVKVVALIVGFSDVAAFDRAFRRWTGMTPSAWRMSPCDD